MPRYYTTETHPAIIDKETFEKARAIMEERGNRYRVIRQMKQPCYPFTGKILCENCGKHYKRVVVAGHVAWQCHTYQRLGREACHAKKIPESTLKSISADVLGRETFDAALFNEKIEMIHIIDRNRLMFVFKDGRHVEREWHDRSRRESWTPDMRERARQKTLEWNAHDN